MNSFGQVLHFTGIKPGFGIARQPAGGGTVNVPTATTQTGAVFWDDVEAVTTEPGGGAMTREAGCGAVTSEPGGGAVTTEPGGGS